MRRCWVLALALALLLGLLFLPLSKGRIDDALASKAETALVRQGVQDVRVSSDWASLTLRGAEGSRKAALAAVDQMADRGAVNQIRYVAQSGVTASAQPNVDVTIAEDGTTPRVRLTGTVPTDADRTALADAAAAAYGGSDQVANELTVTGTGQGATTAVTALATTITELEPSVASASVLLDAQKLTVTGTATDAEAAEAANAAVERAGAAGSPPLTVSGEISVEEPPATGDTTQLEQQLQEAVGMRGITFDTGSARLTPQSRQTLDRVAAVLSEIPSGRVLITGHTDSLGSRALNQDLSERRAAEVRRALVARDVDATRLETTGRGESQPVESNTTSAGRALNRRIIFTVQEN
ncbi:MAG: OmpA family protein [Angustibacter sp.]